MQHLMKLSLLSIVLVFSTSLLAQDYEQIVSIYEDSRVIHDDQLGFEEYPVVVDPNRVRTLEGYLRRQFCVAPQERSALEIIRNYQAAIEGMGGTILFSTRDARSLQIDGTRLTDYLFRHRVNHTRNEHYMAFQRGVSEYLAGRISTASADVYVVIAAGEGFRGQPVFDLITLEVEPMLMDKVTMDMLAEGLALHGRVAVYDIFFDTGSATVKAESAHALEVIAEYVKNNPSQRFLVVGHTDNVGALEMNMELSGNRAHSVVSMLTSSHGVDAAQLKPMGVGPAAPVTSNTTDDGKAQNRRVEIVLL